MKFSRHYIGCHWVAFPLPCMLAAMPQGLAINSIVHIEPAPFGLSGRLCWYLIQVTVLEDVSMKQGLSKKVKPMVSESVRLVHTHSKSEQ